ncbi:MAG TPA: PilZ domain-containing protein [Polyangia bacterium]|nr:PilZ domain-containing protein [Polyangia bacterium]
MLTKRFWGPALTDRRARERMGAGFYAVEVTSDGGRYLRKVANVSRDGVLFDSPFGSEQPGNVVELELPRLSSPEDPVRVKGEVVRVTKDGQVAVRRLDWTLPLEIERLGGRINL